MCKFDECSKRSEGLFCKKDEPPAYIIGCVLDFICTSMCICGYIIVILKLSHLILNSVSEIIKNQ
jgi:hypothetical protein